MSDKKAIEARKAAEAALLYPLTDIDGVGVKSAQVILVLEALGWAPAPKPVAPTEEALVDALMDDYVVDAAAIARGLLASDLFESRAQVQAEALALFEGYVTNMAETPDIRDHAYQMIAGFWDEQGWPRADGLEAGR